MAEGTDTATRLLSVLQALYQTNDKDTRREASKWLEEYQQSTEAWQISDRLLHDEKSSTEILYFCSQTLRTKVQRDYEELPPEAVPSLKASLLTLLGKFGNGPAAVRTQLCLAIAALAAHCPSSEWDPAGSASAGGSGGGIISWLQQQLAAQPAAAPVLLEILTVIVQEIGAHQLAIRPERRRQFMGELISRSPDVMSLLAACAAQAQANPQVLEAALQAFTAWLRFCSSLSAAELAAHPLVHASLAGLQSDDLFETAVEAVCELIRFTLHNGPAELPASMPLVQLIVPQAMALLPRFKASLEASRGQQTGEEEEDEEVLKGMARVYAEIGESYVDLIASGSPESMMIMDSIIAVTSHPDFDIASTTFNFWHALATHLTPKSHSEEGSVQETATAAERERRLALFRPHFQHIVSLVSGRVRYPDGHESWRRDEKADFKDTRYAVADILTDVLQVLGPSLLLQLLSQPLFQAAEKAIQAQQQQQQQQVDWRDLEAPLYCIRAVAGPEVLHERTVLPQVMVLLPSLPQQPQLLYTVSLTVGAYSEWISAAPEASSLLPNLLNLLTVSLSVGEEASSAAALALKHICTACKQQLLSCIDPLLLLYSRVVSHAEASLQLDMEDELQIIEAMSIVVSSLPADHCSKAVAALCQPLTASLQQVVLTAAQAPTTVSPSLYNQHVDRIANVFRYVEQQQPLADAFQSMWPLLKTVFQQRPTDSRVMERLCRMCKYAVRGAQRTLAPALAPLLEELRVQYELYQQPCMLYVASEVVKVFGSEPSCSSYLQQLLATLFARTTANLSTLQHFTEKPDVADDCFLLASRCMRYCPSLVAPTLAFPPLLDCALTGMLIQHREACKSILSFLKDCIELSASDNHSPSYRPQVMEALMARGPPMARLLVAACTGGLPESRNYDVAELMSSLAVGFGQPSLAWFHDALQVIPLSSASNEDKQSLMQSLIQAASANHDSNRIIGAVEDLSGSCRRTRKAMDATQAALLGR